MSKELLGGRVILHAGDCLDVMARLPENSIDACVTDGPYFLPEIAARMGRAGSAAIQQGTDGAYARKAAGFMNKPAIVSDVCNRVATWEAVFRVLKPGAFLLAFNATKAYHRMACAVEDAGFEVRDCLSWLYGTGQPHGKPLDKFVDRKVLGAWCDDDELARGPVSHSAAFFADRDIALKPAQELILMARKPLEGTIGDNLVMNGCGSLDVTACRVEHATGTSWPANVMHDGSPEVMARFPIDASGHSAARFFWHPKADDHDRAGSDHATVKPVTLMQGLVRLVTSTGQTILDPFAGTGTTGEAAWREGRNAVLIEIDEQFQNDIVRRMSLALAGPDERRRESVKAKVGDKPFEAGSLFAGI